MSDTATAPVTPGASDAPTTLAAAAPTLAEQLYTTPPVVPAEAAKPATDAPVVPSVDAKPADVTPPAEDGPEFSQDANGVWHRADGTMASAEEITAIQAQLADEEQTKADTEANRAATVAKVRDRNGNLIEVDTGDEQLAQLINQNTNDGMRRREFLEAKVAVEARESVISRAEAMIEHNPEGFVQENLSDEQQVRLATLLLARHFDALVPIIQGYDANPSSRIATTAEAQLRIKQQSDDFSAHSAAQTSAASVRRAVAALIPDTAEQDVAERFWADANSDVQRALAQGTPITPETVQQVLAFRLNQYGFSGAAPAAPQRPRITLAKPGNSASAAPAAAATKPVNQQRLRLVQQQRNAAAIPPHGRGGPAKPALPTADRDFQNAANLLYGGTTRAS